MEALDQARKDALKAVAEAQKQVDEGIKVGAEFIVAGVSLVNSAYNDVYKTSTDLLDQGKASLLKIIATSELFTG